MFIDRLKEIIEQRHITNAELSRQTGLSKQAIGKWFNGKSNPSFANVVKVAKYLNVDLNYLAGWHPQSNTNITSDSIVNLDNELVFFDNDQELSSAQNKFLNDLLHAYVQYLNVKESGD